MSEEAQGKESVPSATPAHLEAASAGLSNESLEDLLKFLLAETQSESEGAWPTAESLIGTVFESPQWGITRSIIPFGDRTSLYRHEITADFETWLEQQGIDENKYAGHIFEVQYNSIQIYLQKLFPEGYRENAGWRLRVVGYPSLKTIALGIAHHYQGTPAQGKISAVSSMLREVALDNLSNYGDLKSLLSSYPAPTSTDWDGEGLMPTPVHSVGDLDISSYGNARMRMARNTTVKKEIAAFIAIRGMGISTFLEEANTHLDTLRRIGERLGEAHS